MNKKTQISLFQRTNLNYFAEKLLNLKIKF